MYLSHSKTDICVQKIHHMTQAREKFICMGIPSLHHMGIENGENGHRVSNQFLFAKLIRLTTELCSVLPPMRYVCGVHNEQIDVTCSRRSHTGGIKFQRPDGKNVAAVIPMVRNCLR